MQTKKQHFVEPQDSDPPKSLYLEVRMLEDCRDFVKEDGTITDLEQVSCCLSISCPFCAPLSLSFSLSPPLPHVTKSPDTRAGHDAILAEKRRGKAHQEGGGQAGVLLMTEPCGVH